MLTDRLLLAAGIHLSDKSSCWLPGRTLSWSMTWSRSLR